MVPFGASILTVISLVEFTRMWIVSGSVLIGTSQCSGASPPTSVFARDIAVPPPA